MIDGRSYTSNTTKLLKHLDKLEGLQQGIISPVMIHVAPCNICNLECEYCCYAGRALGDTLSLAQVKSVLEQFHDLEVQAVEWTGGGEPTLFPEIDLAVAHAASLGYVQGLITNAISFTRFSSFKELSWMRVSLHGFNEGKDDWIRRSIEKARSSNPNLEISGVYIWTKNSDKVYPRVASFVEELKIPTRITPDLTAGSLSINSSMSMLKGLVASNPHNYAFLSDFNVKTDRRNDHCYMHMVKPFIFPDGWVYVCPSIGLSPENIKNVDSPFRVCKIEDIASHYNQKAYVRHHGCQFCKYSQQNELVDDILAPVKHQEFA